MTLLGTIDETETQMGKRLLRSSILQPFVKETQIKARLDAVEELVTNQVFNHLTEHC